MISPETLTNDWIDHTQLCFINLLMLRYTYRYKKGYNSLSTFTTMDISQWTLQFLLEIGSARDVKRWIGLSLNSLKGWAVRWRSFANWKQMNAAPRNK
jgi:hypothetical protein